MSHIIVFGDSIPWGAWDTDGGWVERLKSEMACRHIANPNSWILVYNASISGNRTSDILKRFECEIRPRIKEDRKAVVIFAIGGNDAVWLKREKRHWTEPKHFEKNVKQLIKLARKYTNNVVFVGPCPANEKKSTPISWDKNKSYWNDDIKDYNNVLKSVCRRENVQFVEIFGRMEKNKEWFEDGVHPNNKAHKKIFLIVKDFLDKKRLLR
jgi:lysophospholipase L1-like esterase